VFINQHAFFVGINGIKKNSNKALDSNAPNVAPLSYLLERSLCEKSESPRSYCLQQAWFCLWLHCFSTPEHRSHTKMHRLSCKSSRQMKSRVPSTFSWRAWLVWPLAQPASGRVEQVAAKSRTNKHCASCQVCSPWNNFR